MSTFEIVPRNSPNFLAMSMPFEARGRKPEQTEANMEVLKAEVGWVVVCPAAADMADSEARMVGMEDIEAKFMVMGVDLEATHPDFKTHNGEATNSKSMMKATRMVLQTLLQLLARELRQVFEPLHSIQSKETLRSRRSQSQIYLTLEMNPQRHQNRMAKP